MKEYVFTNISAKPPLILNVLGTSTSLSRIPDFNIELTFPGDQNYIRNASTSGLHHVLKLFPKILIGSLIQQL